jgi:hypothetical protein
VIKLDAQKVVRRGFDEEDERWFSEEAVLKLKIAQEEIQWLLDRGYKIESIIKLIGDHYQFSIRQRNALQRATASTIDCKRRKLKSLDYTVAKDGAIYIDGFNLIITLEVALSGGVLIIANDGTIKDLAGLRGTYRIVDKTEKALELIGKEFMNLKAPHIKFFLDAPVSNSGRLRNRILEYAANWNFNTEVELVQNADTLLCDMERIVTSDSIILDNCISWFNITRKIINDYIKDARFIDLSSQCKQI